MTPVPAVAEALAAARVAGADAAQIEILEHVAHEGRDVTYEEYLAAANAALDCLRGFPEITEAGIHEYSQDGGKAVSLWLSTASGDEPANKAYQGCYTNHMNFIEVAYQQRAAVGQWRDAIDSQYIDAVRACIEDRGIPTQENWTIADMLQAETDQFPEDDINARCAAVTGYERAITN